MANLLNKMIDYTGASAQQYIDRYTDRPEDAGTLEGLLGLVDKASWVAPPLKSIKGISMLPMLLSGMKKSKSLEKSMLPVIKEIKKAKYFKSYESVEKMQKNPKIKKLIKAFNEIKTPKYIKDYSLGGMMTWNPRYSKKMVELSNKIEKIEPNFFKTKKYVLENKSKYDAADSIEYLMKKFTNKID